MRRLSSRTICTLVVVGLTALAAVPCAGQTWTFKRIADTSTPIPHGTDNFASFQAPAQKNGYVAFQGADANSLQGIYLVTPTGVMKVVADTTTAVPGSPSDHFASFERPCVDGSGNVAFVATTVGGNQGVFGRIGRAKANVAMGRRLLRICYALVRDGKPYRCGERIDRTTRLNRARAAQKAKTSEGKGVENTPEKVAS